jgi:hypothetical protein
MSSYDCEFQDAHVLGKYHDLGSGLQALTTGGEGDLVILILILSEAGRPSIGVDPGSGSEIQIVN